MTATPERSDGLDKVLTLHFGLETISRPFYRPFEYHIYDTDFFPRIENNINGSLNWDSVLKSQANNEKRNNFIVKILRKFNTRTFLVLCKRIEQSNILSAKLREFGEDVDEYYGKDVYFRSDARILLIDVLQIRGRFDHPQLDALLVSGDVEAMFSQYVGRVFRREDTNPIIIDFRDKFGVLRKHLKTREEVYKSIGGFMV